MCNLNYSFITREDVMSCFEKLWINVKCKCLILIFDWFKYAHILAMHYHQEETSAIFATKLYIVVLILSLPNLTFQLKESREPKMFLNKLHDSPRTMTINTRNVRFRPFITCWNCTTFLQCLRRCPFKEYPGLDQ